MSERKGVYPIDTESPSTLDWEQMEMEKKSKKQFGVDLIKVSSQQHAHKYG
jgi:hypothetical protein